MEFLVLKILTNNNANVKRNKNSKYCLPRGCLCYLHRPWPYQAHIKHKELEGQEVYKEFQWFDWHNSTILT